MISLAFQADLGYLVCGDRIRLGVGDVSDRNAQIDIKPAETEHINVS
jgi:hypothetical protein